MGSVAGLWRYPLKSARAEPMSTVDVEAGGVRGDRVWACVDTADGTVGSLKHPRRWGPLRTVEATPDGAVRIDGASYVDGPADEALSALLGRPVRLTRDVPPGARLHRTLPDDAGMVPDWMAGVAAGSDTVSDLGGTGRFVDFGAVHIVTSGELARAGDPDPIRFRPNILLDAPADPESGTVLRVGDAVLRVGWPTPRCIVPGLLPDGTVDRELLGTLARDFRVAVGDLGKAACFGVYADVVQPGTIRLGQPAAIVGR